MGAREQMYPHTLTAWRKAPDGRSVAWRPLGLMRCRWEAERGATSSTTGDVDATSAWILLDSCSPAAPLVRGDRVARGDTNASEPPADALVVTTATPCSVGTAKPDHWEVKAR